MKFKLVKSNRSRQYILLFASLYIMYLIGLLYTSNFYGQEGGLFDIQVKMSLIVFPLIFATLPTHLYSDKTREFALKSFIAGCFLAILICLVIALIQYSNTGSKHEFYYTFISFFLHPSYFSMYLNVAIIILLNKIFLDKKSHTKFRKLILIFLICSFMIFNILLSSKAGIIGMLIMFAIMILYMVIWKKMFFKAVLLLLSASVFITIFLKILPFSTIRMNTVKEAVKKEPARERDIAESSAERILVWGVSWEIIKENFIFGVGTGDVKLEMINIYKKHDYKNAMKLRLNAHNQFLQTFIAIGLIGLLLLILNLILPLFYAFKKQDIIYVMFLILIIFNFLAESMLETQAGVVFYSFMNVIIFSTGKNNKLIS
ncbi:O-antigen ligase family protein [Bacteroidota bacterium]